MTFDLDKLNELLTMKLCIKNEGIQLKMLKIRRCFVKTFIIIVNLTLKFGSMSVNSEHVQTILTLNMCMRYE